MQPLLTDSQVLSASREDTLPSQWRMRVGHTVMHPTLRAGTEIVVVRRRATRGRIACLSTGSRVTFRRVLAVDGQRVFVRGDVAPFADGWFANVIGCVDEPASPFLIARIAPVLWTSSAWHLARGVALARAMGVGARPVAAETAGLSTRTLCATDGDALIALLVESHGGPPERYSREINLAASTVGLFSPNAQLIGRCAVTKGEGDVAESEALVVHPLWRRCGGGALIMRAIVELARGNGARVVRATVAARNLPSRRTLLRAGFRETGRWVRAGDDPLLAAERQLLETEVVLRAP